MTTGSVAIKGSSCSALLTFLLADIRGYTAYTTQFGDDAAADLSELFLSLCREVTAAHEGEVFGSAGDQAVAAFASARQALRAAVALQHRLAVEGARRPGLPLSAGIGLDAGEAIQVGSDYRGGAINLAARLCALAAAGEVLASDAVTHLARKIEGVVYAERGQVELKGFADPVRVIQVLSESIDDLTVGDVAPPGSGPHAQQLPIGGFLGALPSGALVGRDAEMSQIRQAVDAVTGGEGRLILLAGEPGAGKTRLAQEATLELRNRGFVIAAGSSFEPRQSVPYYPFLDVLATLHGAVSAGLRSQLGRRWASMGRLLPEAGIQVPTGTDNPEEQEWLPRAVVGFVRAVAEETPVAILLDDLHWADEASLDLLQRLARQTRGNGVLLLGIYRDIEVQRGAPLERTLRDLHRAGLIEHIPVCPLGQESTRALMAANIDEDISEELVTFVYRQTEGNPFFTQQVLHTLIERGDVYRQNGHWERRDIVEIDVPESVRLVIGERLSRLHVRTQEFLSEASVLGQTFRFDELQALGGHAEEDLEEALEEATRSGIIRETSRDHFSFNHALTQGALYAELSPRRKRKLHLAGGMALEGLPERRREGREAELAWHFLEGDDQERALRYSLLAGDKAEGVFAHGEATHHYRTALDLARKRGDDAQLRAALRKLGVALNFMGRYDAALEALEEAAHLARQANDLDGEMEAVMDLMRLAPERGKRADALRWIDPLLPRLEGYPVAPQKLAFFNAYAYFLVQTVQFDEGLQIAEMAVEMATSLGDESGLARAKVILAHLLLWHGRASEAETVLDPIASSLEQAGDLPEAMRAASLLAQISWFSGDRSAPARRERALRLARQVGNAAQAVYETCMLGYQHLRNGDMDAAWESGRRALAEAQNLDESTMTGAPLGLLATLSWIQGKWDHLERYAGEMIALSEHSDESWWRRHGEHSLALRDLLEGHPDRALARQEPLMAGAKLDIQEQALYLPAFAEAYLETGNVHQAQHVLDGPLALQALNMRGVLPDTLRMHAKLLLAGGDVAGAEAVLNDLLDLTRSMPNPLAEAQTLATFGELEVTRSNPLAARERLREAITIFQRLGARPFVEQSQRALAQLAPESTSKI